MTATQESLEPVRLTRFSHGAGCACKLSPADLRTVLSLVRGFEPNTDPNLLVGFDTSDDAAVYRVRDDLAIVVTTDFFTPIVDDPYDWGRIAATNALSDIYAMGGRPTAVVDALWSTGSSPGDEVLRGLAEASARYGVPVVGGHSNNRSERPQLAVAILGHARRLLTSFDARPGDLLLMAVDLRGGPRGPGCTVLHAAVRELVPPNRADRAMDSDIAAVLTAHRARRLPC